MIAEQHLKLSEISLAPSSEWAPVWKGFLLVWVAEGEGYWMRRGLATQFGAGSFIMVNQLADDSIRSSALGGLKLHYYTLEPQILGGVLSYDELRRLVEHQKKPVELPVLFVTGTPLALKAPSLIGTTGMESVGTRFGRVQLWAEALAASGMVSSPAGREVETASVRERFLKVIRSMPAAELSARSISELSGLVGCSTRHFHRLFKEIHGECFREMQSGQRLARARKYLTESDTKIINIAQETGYNHLGLFNSMFKKRFGMTPGDWRKKSQKKSEPRSRKKRSLGFATLLMMLFLLVRTAPAQTNAPATNAPAPKAFEVRQYNVEGNTILDQKLVDQLMEPALGKEVTFDKINASLLSLQKAYRDRGLITVSVTLPQQKLTNATVRVKVVESPLAAINITENKHYSSNNIMRKLPSLRTNILLNSVILQRELDAANSGRNLQIYSLLGPGPLPETSALNLRVKDRLPLHGRLELDNYNIPNSPALRANVNAQYDNLWDRDHQVGFQYGFTPERTTKYRTTDEVGPLDSPLIANYSGYYRFPIGNQKAVQQEVEASPGRFGYNESAHRFIAPPVLSVPTLTIYASHSTSDTGIQPGPEGAIYSSTNSSYTTNSAGDNITLNNNVGAAFSLPLPDIDGIKFSLGVGIDYKQYKLESYNTNYINVLNTFGTSAGSVTTFDQVPSATNNSFAKLEYLPVNASVNVVVPDKFGTSFFSATANYNAFPIFSGDRAFNNASYQAKARYFAARFNYSREQSIYHEWAASIRGAAQYSPDSLISNEQFGLGGMSSIRGYYEGNTYGDSGWSASVEPHTPLFKVASVGSDTESIPWSVKFSTFLDYGQVYYTSSSAFKSYYNLAGTGAATTWNIGEHFGAAITMGIPLLNTPQTKAGSIRVGFSLSGQF